MGQDCYGVMPRAHVELGFACFFFVGACWALAGRALSSFFFVRLCPLL